jgi:hypothetical protein
MNKRQSLLIFVNDRPRLIITHPGDHQNLHAVFGVIVADYGIQAPRDEFFFVATYYNNRN